jgi:hypothetical protein
VRQKSDPLSPFLFIIVMEALSKMFFAIVDGGFLSSFSMGSKHFSVIHISHLLFVDDTLVFDEANPEYLHYLHALFVVVFGLKVNLIKLELVHVGNVDDIDGLVASLGCRVSSLPLKHLGLLLGPLTRPNLFGMVWLKRLSVSWLVGK